MSHDITFQMEVFVLLGYAQIAATLSGFIGVIFVFGERSQGRLSIHDASAIFHFMFAGLGALFISLVTALSLVCFPGSEGLVWRLANGVGALMHIGGAGRLALESKRGETALRGGRMVSVCGLVAGTFSLLGSAGINGRSEISDRFAPRAFWPGQECGSLSFLFPESLGP